MAEDRHRSKYIPFRCSDELFDTISRIAEGELKNKSEVLRDLVWRGLVAGGYVTGEKEIGQLVQEAVKEVMKPQVERLATISAKAAQISAADFFLHVYTAKKDMPAYEQADLDGIAAKARRLGNEYLKLAKGKDVDQFIDDANKRMANGSMPE